MAFSSNFCSLLTYTAVMADRAHTSYIEMPSINKNNDNAIKTKLKRVREFERDRLPSTTEMKTKRM